MKASRTQPVFSDVRGDDVPKQKTAGDEQPRIDAGSNFKTKWDVFLKSKSLQHFVCVIVAKGSGASHGS